MAITGSHAGARYQKIVSAAGDSPKAVTCRTRLPQTLAVAHIRIRLDSVFQSLALLRSHSVKRNGILFDTLAFALWATNVAFIVFT